MKKCEHVDAENKYYLYKKNNKEIHVCVDCSDYLDKIMREIEWLQRDITEFIENLNSFGV